MLFRSQSKRAKALSASKSTPPTTSSQTASEPSASAPATPTAAPAKGKKLSYKEQRELDELPARIDALETEQKTLNEQLADPDVYRKEGAGVAAMHARVEAIDEALMTLLERWETLSQR